MGTALFIAFSEGDEPPMTACGGNFIGGEISRNEQCPHEADLRRLRLRKGENHSLASKEWFSPAFVTTSSYACRPMVALMRRTPAEEDSSFWILKETRSPVLEAWGPPQISLENWPMV